MFRRCTSMLLIVAYVAGQLAAVPHAHGAGENQPSDHGARPHFHIAWFEHGHSHADGNAHHHHHHDFDGSRSQPVSSTSATGSDGHDSDAIYLPNDTGKPSLASKIIVSLDNLPTNPILAVAVVIAPTAGSGQLWEAHFSGNCSQGTTLYLALRALRI